MGSQAKWYQTIRSKLILTIILATTVVLSFTGYLAYKYIENSEYANLTKLGQVSASRLANHLVIPMWNLDLTQVNRLLEAEMQEDRLAGIVVLDEDGRTLFAGKSRSEDAVIDTNGADLSGFLSEEEEVVNRGERIGSVEVYLTPAFLERELRQFGQGVIITVVILNLVIFLTMMVVLGKMLVRPLNALSLAAEKISRGDLKQVLVVSSSDEIGRLTESFNRMQSSLKIVLQRMKARQKKG